MLRRIRGAIGTGVAWALAWATVETAVLGATLLLGGLSVPLIAFAARVASGATFGFLSGLVFSTAFSIVNRSKSFEEIRLGQTTLLGAGAGTLFPTAFLAALAVAGIPIPVLAVVVNLLTGAGMGALTSYGLVRIARSGSPTSIAGDGVRRIGLTATPPSAARALDAVSE